MYVWMNLIELSCGWYRFNWHSPQVVLQFDDGGLGTSSHQFNQRHIGDAHVLLKVESNPVVDHENGRNPVFVIS
jgi:hypothetical protein